MSVHSVDIQRKNRAGYSRGKTASRIVMRPSYQDHRGDVDRYCDRHPGVIPSGNVCHGSSNPVPVDALR